MSSTDGTMKFFVGDKEVSSAKPGDKVHVVVTTEDGKAVKKLTVKHMDGKADLLLTGDTFIMPECDIRVMAEIVSGYPITLETNYSGKAIATVGGLGVTSASRDAKVLVVSNDPAYEIESVTAYYRSMLGTKKDLAITNNGFAMPEAAVTVKVSLKPVTTYDFYVYSVSDLNDLTTVGMGSFFLSVNGGQVSKAAKGTEVKIVAQPLEGYAVTGISVTKHDDSSVTVGVFSNTFTMPGFDVDVAVEFGEKGNNIVFMPAKGGTAHAEDDSSNVITEANTGDEVTLVAEPVGDYDLDHWTVIRNKDGYKVTVSGDKFTMPAGGVTVTPVFIGKTAIPVSVELFLDGAECTTNKFLVGAEVSVGGASAASTYKVYADKSPTDVQDKDGNDPYSGDYISVAYDCPKDMAFEKVLVTDSSDATIAEYADQLKAHDFFELDANESTEVIIKVYFSANKIALPKAAVKGVGAVSYINGNTEESIGSAKAGDTVGIVLSPGDHYMFDFRNPEAFDGTFHKFLKVTRKDNGAELPLNEVDSDSDSVVDYYTFEMPDCGVDVQAEFLPQEYTINIICTDVTNPSNPIDITGKGFWQIKVGDEKDIADNMVSFHNAHLNDIVIASMTEAGKSKYDMVSFNINGWDYTANVKNYAYNFKIADLRALYPTITIEAKLKAKDAAPKALTAKYDASKGNVEFILISAVNPYNADQVYDLTTPAGPYIKQAYPGDMVGVLVSPSSPSYTPNVGVKGGDATVITPTQYVGGTDHSIDVNGDGSVDDQDIVYVFMMPNTNATANVSFVGTNYGVTFDLASSTMPDGSSPVDFNLLKATIDGGTYRDINSSVITFPDAKAGSVVSVVRTEYAKAQALKIQEMIVTGDDSGNGVSVKAITDGFSFTMPAEPVTVTFNVQEDLKLKPIKLNQTGANLSVGKYKDSSGNLISTALPGDLVCIYPADVVLEKGYTNAGANDEDLLQVFEKGYNTNIATWNSDHWEFTMPEAGYTLKSNVKLLSYTISFSITGTGSGEVNVNSASVPIKKVVNSETLVVTYGESVSFSLVSGNGDKKLTVSCADGDGTVSGKTYKATHLTDGATITVNVVVDA